MHKDEITSFSYQIQMIEHNISLGWTISVSKNNAYGKICSHSI